MSRSRVSEGMRAGLLRNAQYVDMLYIIRTLRPRVGRVQHVLCA